MESALLLVLALHDGGDAHVVDHAGDVEALIGVVTRRREPIC